MGYLPGKEVDRSRREALEMTDPKLKLFAAISQLSRFQ